MLPEKLRDETFISAIARAISDMDEIAYHEVDPVEDKLVLRGKPGKRFLEEGEKLITRLSLVREMYDNDRAHFQTALKVMIRVDIARAGHNSAPVSAADIVPLIRDIGYLGNPVSEEFVRAFGAGTPIDYSKTFQVAEPYIDQLYVAYYEDTGDGFQSFAVSRAPHGFADLEAIRHLAIENLAEKLGTWDLLVPKRGKVHAIDAERESLVLSVLLVPGARESVQRHLGRRLAVSLPTTYDLFVVNGGDADAVLQLREKTIEYYSHEEDRPQSDQIYEWTDSGLVPWPNN